MLIKFWHFGRSLSGGCSVFLGWMVSQDVVAHEGLTALGKNKNILKVWKTSTLSFHYAQETYESLRK